MEHIRQKNSDDKTTYTVVNTTGYQGKLTDHISIVHHPELFEIVDAEIPEDAQYLNYSE